MPEGPEVRNVAMKLQQKIADWQLVAMTFPEGSQFIRRGLPGYESFSPPYTINSISCKGKLIVFILVNEQQIYYLLSHLIMTGRWHFDAEATHIRAILHLSKDGQQSKLYLSDSRSWAKLHWLCGNEQLAQHLNKTGLDILQTACAVYASNADHNQQFQTDYQKWYNKIYEKNSRGNYRHANKQICQILMDQSLCCGIGNYLKAEILYACNMAPNRQLKDINAEEIAYLWASMLRIIYTSFCAGGLTIRDYWSPDGKAGVFQKVIYGCSTAPCGNPVVTGKFKDGRTTHWVPASQK